MFSFLHRYATYRRRKKMCLQVEGFIKSRKNLMYGVLGDGIPNLTLRDIQVVAECYPQFLFWPIGGNLRLLFISTSPAYLWEAFRKLIYLAKRDGDEVVYITFSHLVQKHKSDLEYAWGAPLPEIDDLYEPKTEEDRQRQNELLALEDLL